MSRKYAAYQNEWVKENLKRIPFNVRKEWYRDVMLPAAEAAGEPVNTFIRHAVEERYERMQAAKE